MEESLTIGRAFGRNDFAALRGYVQRLSPSVLARTYYDADEHPHAQTPAAMERYLRGMLDELVNIAIEHGSRPLADHLKASKRQHGDFARIGAVALKMVFEAAEIAAATPQTEHSVGMWFKPMVSRNFRSVKIQTLGDLVAFCNRRGGSWWRAIPRVGAGRAIRIVSWLRQHANSLGVHVDADVDLRDPLVADAADLVVVDREHQRLVPLERIQLAIPLAGTNGINRAPTFPLIHARDDLQAIRAYLHLYRDQPKTLRSYTKELERFVLWCVTERGVALSSVLVEECEAYKDFLKAPSSRFVGPRSARHSHRWRPFAAEALSPESQVYAVRVIRSAFSWLVHARYLGSNPWKLVSDPITVETELSMRVERALSTSLWDRLRTHMNLRCEDAAQVRWRTVRALVLLMGDSGVRREEAFTALRQNLRQEKVHDSEHSVWALSVLGKRRRERTVPVSDDTIMALRAHWRDRDLDFDKPFVEGPLLAPPLAKVKKDAPPRPNPAREWAGYHPDSGNHLLDWAKKHFVAEIDGLTHECILALNELSPHALRHTFGTLSVAHEVPLDVVQRILGHRSLNTTSIYVQAEKQRMLREAATYYDRKERSEASKSKKKLDTLS